MAYPNYYPQFYPTPISQIQPPATTQSTPGITWVQGEAAAKAYPVGAGQSVLLMDSEESVLYIKSTDQSGMPLPLRIFDYTERTPLGTNRGQSEDKSGTNQGQKEDYISRQEFEEFKEDIKRTIKGIRKPRITEEDD